MNFAAVSHFTDVEPILEQMRERSHPENASANDPTGRKLAELAPDSSAIKVFREGADRPQLQVPRKDRANRLGFGRQHDDLFAHRGVAERYRAAHPNSLALRG